jgi:hypothetical protein
MPRLRTAPSQTGAAFPPLCQLMPEEGMPPACTADAEKVDRTAISAANAEIFMLVSFHRWTLVFRLEIAGSAASDARDAIFSTALGQCRSGVIWIAIGHVATGQERAPVRITGWCRTRVEIAAHDAASGQDPPPCGDYMSGGAVKPNFWALFQFHPFFCST